MFLTKFAILLVVGIAVCRACQGNMRSRQERQQLRSAQTAIAEGDTAAASQLTGAAPATRGSSPPARSPAAARARAQAAANARSRTADGQTRGEYSPFSILPEDNFVDEAFAVNSEVRKGW
ncbi:unnamed protein product [Cylicocyclus nassatus]|uniref:Secreted protein n=1 Tax=Cylicocyclus nassatus TaxID=53992 RepID=A0AA36MBG5_CYLNA|nr:unnamed protein product [Cylicocyclus nassatus]